MASVDGRSSGLAMPVRLFLQALSTIVIRQGQDRALSLLQLAMH